MKQKILYTYDSGIRAMIEEEGAVIRSAHVSGAGGGEVVQRRTALIDRTLREIHVRLSEAGPMPALVAVGGYGRGELNPHSDIDVMFLCRGESYRERAPEMLYRLWDAGLDVGYSVRTVDECVELGRKDIKIRTSLMESRLIAGDSALYDAFLAAMRADVFFWKAASFIQDKVAERRSVRQKYGGSIYLREPNVKEGTGGLRDVHTAFWIAAARFRIGSLGDLGSLGIVTPGQYAVFQRSRNFLWRVRNEIHYVSERKNDHLTFDLQERAAADFGYRSSSHLLAVERFMKAYFIHAKNISEFSAVVNAAVLRRPGRQRFPWFTRTATIGPFTLAGRTIVPSSEDGFRNDPLQALAAFELMQTRRALFSDRLKSLVRETKIGDEMRRSPAAANIFLSILDNPDRLAETLMLMKDLRFLGRYIPEFRAIQSLARHDYYHKYTVDEHILLAVRRLQDLWEGRSPGLPSLVEAFRRLRRKRVLMLAVLLHDLGKAFRSDHERHGAEAAERVLGRMGVGGEERERILFLVRNHLLMSSLSQRRELTDRKVIAHFASRVRDRENLDMLALLTYADISAVSPTAWTQWKAALLDDLYRRTLACLGESAAAAEEEHARRAAASARVRTAAEGLFAPEEVECFLSVMPEQYLLVTPAHKVIDHMGMMKRLPSERLVIEHRHDLEKGATELTVCAYDAYGMLSRTAGTLAAKNLNIVRARAFTTKNGVMIDTFLVTDSEGAVMTYEDAWASLVDDLRRALTAPPRRAPEPGVYGQEKPAPGAPAPSVEFDNDGSDSFTIIDITGRDRVGLLHRIARTLYDLNVDIASAKIVTEGTRVMDSFYVSDLFKKKIVDAKRIEKIRESLLAVLE